MQYNGICSKNQQDCNHCYVKSLTLCSSLSDKELLKLTPLLTHQKVSAGETLFMENDHADYIYTITGGHLKRQKSLPDGRTQIIGFSTPGDIVGAMLQDKYSYTVEAIGTCTLCRFPRVQFKEFVDKHPAMDRAILKKIAQEMRDYQDLMLLLGRKNALEKVASFLFYLSEKARRIGLSQYHILLPMTRTEIADYLGLTTESVSRAFTKLKEMKVIESNHPKRVDITNLAQLEKIKDDHTS